MEIKASLLPTSVTYSGEFLSSGAKIPRLFEINESSSENTEDGGRIRFQFVGETDLQTANERFNEELEQQINGKLPKGYVYQLGSPGHALLSAGVPDFPIEMSAKRLARKSSENYKSHHPFSLGDVRNLPEALHRPIAVFDSSTHEGVKVVLVELEHEGHNFVVALQVRRNGKSRSLDVEVNSIRSLYPKDSKNGILQWINNGLMRWVDKEKMKSFISTQWPNYIAGGNEALEKGIAYLSSASQPVRQEIDKQDLNTAAKIVQDFENPATEDENLYCVVDDQATIDRLESGPRMTAYRAMQVIDGRLYSPMAAKVGGKLTADNPMGAWTEAEETVLDFTPEQREAMDALDRSDKKGDVDIIKGRLRYHKGSKTGRGTLQFHLVKGDGSSLWAAYNPYIHSSLMMLNDQFTSAYKRPNIVVVEVEIPTSELTSGYRAERAKDTVGMAEWKAGPVAGQLPGGMARKVMLSRWSKVRRIVPYAEVADHVAAVLGAAESKKGGKLRLPLDSFHPELRKELEKRGFRFEPGPYTMEKAGKRGRVQKSWEDMTDEEKRKAYNGAAYMDDAAIARLNGEYGGEWLRREGEGAVTDDGVSSANDPYAKMLGGSRFTPTGRARYAGRIRERMTEHVRDLARTLHLDNVEVVADGSAFPDKRGRAKGFYNRRTGKITIITGNHESLADVERTLLHEAVAHYGLRRLFGEQFDRFLDNVYGHADAAIREKIEASMRKNGWSRRTATEEYLAGLAETTDFRSGHPGFFDQVKQAFLDMLHALGFDYIGPSLTDNELRYILWRSYKNLAEPGSFTSILGEAEDLRKREELGVGYHQPEGARGIAAEETDAGSPEEINERFNEQLGMLTEENADHMMLSLGRPSAILRSVGIPDMEIRLYGNKILKKSKAHGYTKEDLHDLPRAIQNPISVFRGSYPDSYSVLTEVTLNGEKALVSIDIKKGEAQGVNLVTSVYGKKKSGILSWISKGKLLYSDKKKTLDYISPSAPIADATYNQEPSAPLSFLSHQSAPIAATAANAGQQSSESLSSASQYVQQEIDKLDTAAKVVENFENPTPEEAEKTHAGENLLFRMAGEARDGESMRRGLNNDSGGAGWSRETMREAWDKAMGKAMFLAREGYADYLASVDEFQKLVARASGRAVGDLENVYRAMLQLSSRNANEMKLFESALARPLQRAVLNLAGAVKDFKEGKGRELARYMMAKHGIERNRDMAVRAAMRERAGSRFREQVAQAAETEGAEAKDLRKHPRKYGLKTEEDLYGEYLDAWYREADGIRRRAEEEGWTWRQTQEALTGKAATAFGADVAADYSGLSGMYGGDFGEAAYKAVEDYEAAHPKDALDALWEAARAVSGFCLEKQRRSGLTTGDYEADQLRRYEWYVPLRGWADPVAEDMYDYIGAQRGELGSPVKTAKGRKSEAADPLGGLLTVAYRSIFLIFAAR